MGSPTRKDDDSDDNGDGATTPRTPGTPTAPAPPILDVPMHSRGGEPSEDITGKAVLGLIYAFAIGIVIVVTLLVAVKCQGWRKNDAKELSFNSVSGKLKTEGTTKMEGKKERKKEN